MSPATIGRATASRGDCQTQPAELVGRHEGWVFCSLTTNRTGWAGQPETRLSVCLFCGKATIGGEDIHPTVYDSILQEAQCKKGEASTRGRGLLMNNGTAESASAANMRIVALLCLDEIIEGILLIRVY
jgi:hypothetical protein